VRKRVVVSTSLRNAGVEPHLLDVDELPRKYPIMETSEYLQLDGYHFAAPTSLSVGSGLVLSEGTEAETTELTQETVEPKQLKIMAKPDRLLTQAALAAVKQAGLTDSDLKTDTGIYVTTGYQTGFGEFALPAARSFTRGSDTQDSELETNYWADFAKAVTESVNPRFLFASIDSPLFHVSKALGIQGPSVIMSPSAAQWFQVLRAAWRDLKDGKVRFALLCATAEMRSTLSRLQNARMNPSELRTPVDTATCMVLRKGTAPGRIARISLRRTRHPHSNFGELGSVPELNADAGPVTPSLAILLSLKNSGAKEIHLTRIDHDGALAVQVSRR